MPIIDGLAVSMAKIAVLQSAVLGRMVNLEVWLTALIAVSALSALTLEPLSCTTNDDSERYPPACHLPGEHHAGLLSRLMVAKAALKLTLIVWWKRGVSTGRASRVPQAGAAAP